jgi:predicted TIM-barrel fold metal-dependent hydrolase
MKWLNVSAVAARTVPPASFVCLLFLPELSVAQNTRETATYRRIKVCLDAVPAIDTHDHLVPFDRLTNMVQTDRGKGMNLAAIWKNSYYSWYNPCTPWKPGMKFDDWWATAKNDFVNARATGFYRFLLPAFQDLYRIDFDSITDSQAAALDRRIFDNYRDPRWLYQVITERANIELILNDPYWARFAFKTDYPFVVLVLNVNSMFKGTHPSELRDPMDDPYRFAREHNLTVNSLDDYVNLLDRIVSHAKGCGAVCLKQTLAYERTLDFQNVPRDRAAAAFGRPRSKLRPQEIRDFEDFIMWRLVELAAKHDLPIQIHTGHARIQGSNPMLLVDLIQANPRTKFVLFHGGYPWVGETGAIVTRQSSHVWIDSVWLPTISYTMAKRAFHEWLEVMPSNRILWGADCNHAEGVYGATEFTRRCLAEVLAEKVDRGDLAESHALRIGRQILRDNALELFPRIKDQLWKHKGRLLPPVTTSAPAPGK